jgi:ankyrin repeat protein
MSADASPLSFPKLFSQAAGTVMDTARSVFEISEASAVVASEAIQILFTSKLPALATQPDPSKTYPETGFRPRGALSSRSGGLVIPMREILRAIDSTPKLFAIIAGQSEFKCHLEVAAALSDRILGALSADSRTFSVDVENHLTACFVDFLNGRPLDVTEDQISQLSSAFALPPLKRNSSLSDVLTTRLLARVPPTLNLRFGDASFRCSRLLAAAVSERITEELLNAPEAAEVAFPFSADTAIFRELLNGQVVASSTLSSTTIIGLILALNCRLQLPSLLSSFWRNKEAAAAVKDTERGQLQLRAEWINLANVMIPPDFRLVLDGDIFPCHRFVIQSVSGRIREFLSENPTADEYPLKIHDPGRFFQFIARFLAGEHIVVRGHRELQLIAEVSLLLDMPALLPSLSAFYMNDSAEVSLILNTQFLLDAIGSVRPDLTICVRHDQKFQCSFFIAACLSNEIRSHEINVDLPVDDVAMFVDFLNYRPIEVNPESIALLSRAALALNIYDVLAGSFDFEIPARATLEAAKEQPKQLRLSPRTVVDMFRSIRPYFYIETRRDCYQVHLPIAVYFSDVIRAAYRRAGALSHFKIDTDADLSFLADFLNFKRVDISLHDLKLVSLVCYALQINIFDVTAAKPRPGSFFIRHSQVYDIVGSFHPDFTFHIGTSHYGCCSVLACGLCRCLLDVEALEYTVDGIDSRPAAQEIINYLMSKPLTYSCQNEDMIIALAQEIGIDNILESSYAKEYEKRSQLPESYDDIILETTELQSRLCSLSPETVDSLMSWLMETEWCVEPKVHSFANNLLVALRIRRQYNEAYIQLLCAMRNAVAESNAFANILGTVKDGVLQKIDVYWHFALLMFRERFIDAIDISRKINPFKGDLGRNNLPTLLSSKASRNNIFTLLHFMPFAFEVLDTSTRSTLTDSSIRGLPWLADAIKDVITHSGSGWSSFHELAFVGWNPSPIATTIRLDDIASFQEQSAQSGFSFEQLVPLSVFDRQPNWCELGKEADAAPYSFLEYAALCGSVNCFKFILPNGFAKKTAIQCPRVMKFAIIGGNTEIIRLCDQREFDGRSGVRYAVELHRNNVLEWFRDGKDVVLNQDLENTPGILRWCIRGNNLFAMTFLWAKIPYLDANQYEKAVHHSIRHSFLDMAKVLLEHHSFSLDKFRPPILCEAAEKNNKEFFRFLIEKRGRNVNEMSLVCESPLMICVRNGYLDLLTILMSEFHANVNLRDQRGNTAVHHAIMAQHLDLLIFLLAMNGLHTNIASQDGSEMTLAAQTRNLDIVKCIGDDGRFNVNARDRNGNTALMIACKLNEHAIIEYLLSQPNIDVNATNFHFECALGFAAREQDGLVLRKLTEIPGIEPNMQDSTGHVPLFIAVSTLPSLDNVEALLRIPGIDVTITSPEGISPVTLAMDSNRLRLLDMLLQSFFTNHPDPTEPISQDFMKDINRYLEEGPAKPAPILEIIARYASH